MWQSTCVPATTDNALYKFKPIFRCAQGRHFWMFCWLWIALILDSGKGTLKGWCPYLPAKRKDWTLMRMGRSGQWDADILVTCMAYDVLRYLPPPADGVIHRSGDATRKDKRGQKHPLDSFAAKVSMRPIPLGLTWCCSAQLGPVPPTGDDRPDQS